MTLARRPLELDVPEELALARLAATVRPALRQHALAALDGPAPLPALLAATATRRDLARLLPVWRAAPALRSQEAWLGRAFIAAIEADPAVITTRAGCGTWLQLRALTAERQRVASTFFGSSLRALLAAAMGLDEVPAERPAPLPPSAPPPGWLAPEQAPPVSEAALRAIWRQLVPDVPDAGWSVRGDEFGWTVVLDRRAGAARGAGDVTSAVPLGATSVRGWAVALHELGHAVVGAVRGPLPRLPDERAALAAQRWLATPGWLPWIDARIAALADAGFAALVDTAHLLLALEAAPSAAPSPAFAPPRALVEDPGAQAAYVTAAAAADTVAPLDGAGLLTIGQ